MRIGLGYDVHAFVAGRAFFLGGIKLDYPKGLQGHSDGDVLCHAIADAVLGAAAHGDIGEHFPPNDPKWKGVRGPTLLSHVQRLVAARGLSIRQVDATVILEEPKIAPFREAMRAEISSALGIERESVSVKATTQEGLGAIGRGEGAAAIAVAIVE